MSKSNAPASDPSITSKPQRAAWQKSVAAALLVAWLLFLAVMAFAY